MTVNSRTEINFASLFADLPPESQQLVEQFVLFLREQARRGQKVAAIPEDQGRVPYLYPTVAVPAESLTGLIGLISEGYDGDALEDTEALYNHV